MPIVKVYCVPGKPKADELSCLCRHIVSAVLSVQELGLSGARDVTVLFVPDLLPFDGQTIIAEIVGLYAKPERTKEVQDRLAANVGAVLKEEYERARIEVFVYPFTQSACGFWSND